MSREFLEKLLEYIDIRIDEKLAIDSSDGGLIESIKKHEIKEELFDYVDS